MSIAIDGARQRLVDELVAELQELIDRRNELLCEVFALMRYAEMAESSDSPEFDEEAEAERLKQFLERFDLQKNPESGSVLSLELPELVLRPGPSRQSSPVPNEEEASADHALDSSYMKHEEDEEDDLQYPATSPISARTRQSKAALQDESMDVDAPTDEHQPSSPLQYEESPVNVEDDDEVPEPRTPPRTRARTRTTSPIASRKKKRRRSGTSDETEPIEDFERARDAPHDARQTRSKLRKVTPPAPPPVEDEDRDELDIISASSPPMISPVLPPRRRTLPLHFLPRRAQPEPELEPEPEPAFEEADDDDSREIDIEEQPSEIVEAIEEGSHSEEKFVPPSPSTPSVHSPERSLSIQRTPSEQREIIRAPRPREPQIVDTTPLTPPRSPPPPVVIELSLHQPEKLTYQFVDPPVQHQLKVEPEIKTEHEPSLPSATDAERARAHALELKLARRHAIHYPLPPLAALPAEFNRKGKPNKSRKKDRDRSGSDSGRKDDWVPLGMSKWAALLMANPAYKKLSRATKCVTTRDWNTASIELKLIRTFERIETLKRIGKWSFRQLKKQRVAAGLVKTHWDYLMDEMKWMQVDFREERRWKMALAHELALEVQEWHAAGSHEERIRLGICARWRRPDPLELEAINGGETMEVDIIPPSEHGDEGRIADPEEDMEVDKAPASTSDYEDVEDQRAVNAVLNPDIHVPNHVAEDDHQEFIVPDATESPSFTMKLEEVEGADAIHLAGASDHDASDALQLPQDTVEHWAELPKTEAVDASQALREISQNLFTDPLVGPETGQVEPKSLWTPDEAKVIRSSIISLPEQDLFVNMDQIVPMPEEDLARVLSSEGPPIESSLGLDLTTIFPELQPFSMLDGPTSEIAGNGSDGRRRNDKKADKDDPTKRVEETTYTRLCPTTRFMHMKPTLVSALQPAKKWRQGRWVDLDESPVVSDVDSPPSFSGTENTCSLFEGRKISIPFQPPLPLRDYSKLPRITTKTIDITWSPAEDNLLKSLAERYPSNWRLVTDALNSSRIRTSIDLRTPQECFERWRLKCGLIGRSLNPSSMHPSSSVILSEEASSNNAAEVLPPPSAASTSTSPMTTRGVKRLATSAAQHAATLSVSTGANTVESRKRKRHLIIIEAARRTAAKRKQRKQDAMKYQSASVGVAPMHDTHAQFTNKQRYTPSQLSVMKAEKERKDVEFQVMRRRELETKRLQQQQQHQQQQQLHAQLQQAQQQMNQQNGALQQNVAQIRSQANVSQHQQQNLASQVGSVPLSSQMMQQVQAAQQARALAQAQAQAQQSQAQSNAAHMQGQIANSQINVNGNIPHLSAQFANHGGATSPVPHQSSPPRSGATPVNSAGAFPRPSSAQRNVAMPGAQVLPMAGGSVPIARTNNALAAYFNNGGVQYTPEQMSQLMRYQQQQLQMQQQQQQQQPVQMQMQMQMNQQNALQGGLAGYPQTGQ